MLLHVGTWMFFSGRMLAGVNRVFKPVAKRHGEAISKYFSGQGTRATLGMRVRASMQHRQVA